MKALQKIEAFGMKALQEATGRDLVTLYRWRKALSDGRGVSDSNKRVLIDVTAGSAHAIEWSDFAPAEGRALEEARP